jgi:imidazolonepropionase-like amidohydrolase
VAKAERLRPVVYLSTEAWAVADQVAAAKADVVQHSRLTWFKPRADRRTLVGGGWRYDAPALLARAGVRCAVGCASDTVQTWGVAGRDLLNLPLEAAFAQRGGLTPQQALESITIVPARILGVADRVGSLEVGKDADVILTDGDLLDYRTFVRTTIVNGRVAYEAKDDRFWRGVIAHRDGVAPAPAASPRSAASAVAPRSPAGE